jgi:hypothetical protein
VVLMVAKPWKNTHKPWRVRFWETHLSFVPDFVGKTNVWYLHPRTARDMSKFVRWVGDFCPHRVVIRHDRAISARYWLSKNADGFYGCYPEDAGVPMTLTQLIDESTVFRFRDADMAFAFKMQFG